MTDRLPPAAPARASTITTKQAAGVAGLLATAAAAALAFALPGLKADEGKRTVDYLDIARVPTACYGHTGADVRVGTRRTDAQCDALLATDAIQARDGVLACVPALAARPVVWAASTRMAYNTGIKAFCGSGVARAFNAGRWAAGCDAMLPWSKARIHGRLVVVPGLLARRQRERAQCLTGVAA